MKTKTYILRPVTDLRDIVLYYEFVRKEDDAILRSSKDYDFLLAYGEGYATKTGLLFLSVAAFITARIAFAIRPCLPMTLPISSSATWSSRMTASGPSVSVTLT